MPLVRVHMCSESNSPRIQDTHPDEYLHAIVSAAIATNSLAKSLSPGPLRLQAYRVKASILDALILQGLAVVNGVRADGMVGLDILQPPCLGVRS